MLLLIDLSKLIESSPRIFLWRSWAKRECGLKFPFDDRRLPTELESDSRVKVDRADRWMLRLICSMLAKMVVGARGEYLEAPVTDRAAVLQSF